ncbi:hypothetical protein BGZ60DRAFT_395270 [Tricladium varicosporioides]|nr:hypothetical protein BGZ60DRAFT_395270 [Hymenoscyphus varicosporioides]
MPPKKLPPEKLRNQIEKYDILFEGPVPPRKWPDRYRHLFQVIRDIWANRYDEYTRRTDIDRETIDKQMTRVRTVVDKATRFRKNIGSHEDTWRDAIENATVGLFVEEVVCRSCGRELWDSEYKARPHDKYQKDELERKSQKRGRCNCHHLNESVIFIDEDSDEEQGEPIFQSVVGQEVSHEPEDNLANSGIPMKPDRVIGLSRTEKFRGSIDACIMNLVHDPVKSDDMVYPFLVLEAKRERNPPGFRAIEAQTAFSIRRFLRIQEDLRTSCQGDFDPLVWFFAYQGDEWRLYAAVINHGKTRVFQLWLGILESEDGALQLLQIVDFIWTWARDVYRPQIRRCLAGVPNPYKRSPSFDDRIVHSQPGHKSVQAQLFSQPPFDSVQEEYSVAEVENSSIQGQGAENYGQQNFEETSYYPFLRWALCRDLSKSWALKSSIRHSDIVMFSFRVFEVPDTKEGLQDLILSLQDYEGAPAVMSHLLTLIKENPYTFVLKRGNIPEIEKSWTGANAQSSYWSNIANSDEAVRTFFFFRSYFQSNNWQPMREMYCIVWSLEAAKMFGNLYGEDVELGFGESAFQCVPPSEVIQTFQQLRGLSGKHSMAHALLCTSFTLQPIHDVSLDRSQVQWSSPQDRGQPTPIITQLTGWFDLTLGRDVVQLRKYQSHNLLQVFPDQQPSNTPLRLLQFGDNFGQLEALMAVKADSWPQECPRFCLFVLLDQDFDNEGKLRLLLHDAIRVHKFFGVCRNGVQGQPSWSADDKIVLQNWQEYFSEENMLDCKNIPVDVQKRRSDDMGT